MSVQRKPRENHSDNDKQLVDKRMIATSGKGPTIGYNKPKSPFVSHTSGLVHGPTQDWETRGWENAKNLNGTNNKQSSSAQDISGGLESIHGYSYSSLDVWGRAPSDAGGGGQKLVNSSSPRVDMSHWVFGGNKVEQISPPALDLSEFPTLSSTVSSTIQEESSRPSSHPSVSPQLSGYYSAAVGANRVQSKGNVPPNGKRTNMNSFPSLNSHDESIEKFSDMEAKSRIGLNDTDWQRNLTSYSDAKLGMRYRNRSAPFTGSNMTHNDDSRTSNPISSDDFGNVSNWMSSNFGSKNSKYSFQNASNNFEQSNIISEPESYTTNFEVASTVAKTEPQSDFSQLSSKLSEISFPHDTLEIYGIRGLLKLMSSSWRTEQPDYLLLTLGIDLTSLGLNLNSTEPLYLSFETPFLDMDRGLYHEPEYILPECYKMEQKPPLLKLGHFRKFQLQTLFYIFYCMPRDALQILAAAELYQREWRYHKDLKLWFTRAPGTTTPGYERNAFIYFDITTWERKPFHETNRNFLQGFLPQNVITEAVEHLKMAVYQTHLDKKEPLIQRFRKGRGLGVSVVASTQDNDTLLVLSETDRVQCLVDHSIDLDCTLKWTLLIPPSKKLTCSAIPIGLCGVQFLGVLDEHDITLWDSSTEEFGVLNWKIVGQVPYPVARIIELVFGAKTCILVISSTGYQLLDGSSFDTVFSFVLQNNCEHICSRVVKGSVFPASLGFRKESDYCVILGVVNHSPDTGKDIFFHIFDEECCKCRTLEWNVKFYVEESTIQSLIFYEEQQNDEICSLHLCMFWSCGILEFRMITFDGQEPIIIRRITLPGTEFTPRSTFLFDLSNDYFGILFKESLQIWHKKWKLCFRKWSVLKELGIVKDISRSRFSHLGDDNFCIYGCFVNGLVKWNCELPQLSLSQILEMKRIENLNIQDFSCMERKGQIFSEDMLEALSMTDNDTRGDLIMKTLSDKEKEWINHIEQGLYSSKDILEVLQEPQSTNNLDISSAQTSQHHKLYEKPSSLLISTILMHIFKVLKDGDLSYTAVLEFLVKRHWIDYSMMRSCLISLESQQSTTKNPILFPFLWRNHLFSLCLEFMKHIVDLPPIEVIYLIQQVSNNRQQNSFIENDNFYLEQLFTALWQRPFSTKDMMLALEMLPFRDVILQLHLFEDELESILHTKRWISKAWIAWIALILDTYMFALLVDSKGIQHLNNVYKKVKQLEQLTEIMVSVEPLVRSFVERQQLFFTNKGQHKHWVEYYSFTL
ncbi:Probable NOT transcription complex subunit VIP2 [Galdieria sulphuraria]|nr:Probable NOT transcription complex subunit VIP2 [Galdieria sulphuraria]